MTQEEVQRIVDLLNTMIDEEATEEVTEAEVVKEFVYPDEEKTKKMFRNQVPEEFKWEEVEVVRSPITGDRVFMLFNGEKRWIPDLGTLEAMGWELSDVKNISDDEMRTLSEKYGILASRLW
jgi:hypothetical protein